jgi:hypothetical protein
MQEDRIIELLTQIRDGQKESLTRTEKRFEETITRQQQLIKDYRKKSFVLIIALVIGMPFLFVILNRLLGI